MPKRSQGLTARAVQVMKTPGLFADEKNLYLQVTAGGAKTWIFRYQIAGRRREMGLGSLSLVSLIKARGTAANLRRMVAAGIDPLAGQRTQVNFRERMLDNSGRAHAESSTTTGDLNEIRRLPPVAGVAR